MKQEPKGLNFWRVLMDWDFGHLHTMNSRYWAFHTMIYSENYAPDKFWNFKLNFCDLFLIDCLMGWRWIMILIYRWSRKFCETCFFLKIRPVSFRLRVKVNWAWSYWPASSSDIFLLEIYNLYFFFLGDIRRYVWHAQIFPLNRVWIQCWKEKLVTKFDDCWAHLAVLLTHLSVTTW